ncbi:MAG: transposase, partial [Carboxylicivirga sp.]|nr:transposase [Carboxylicivirga sp.]
TKSSNVHKNQFWRHDNKPIELWSNKVIDEKIRYIHNNPVEEGLVFSPEDYVYSSARDYSGEKGMLDVIVIK